MIPAEKLINHSVAPVAVKLTRAEARRIKNRSAADKLANSVRKTPVRQYIVKHNKQFRLVTQYRLVGKNCFHSEIGRVVDSSEVEIDPVTKRPQFINQKSNEILGKNN